MIVFAEKCIFERNDLTRSGEEVDVVVAIPLQKKVEYSQRERTSSSLLKRRWKECLVERVWRGVKRSKKVYEGEEKVVKEALVEITV